MLYAVEAKTGKPVDSFGNKGRLPAVEAAMLFKYKGTREPVGLSMTSPPTYHNGTLLPGACPFGESSARLIW